MSDIEDGKKPVTVTREELHWQLWETPMTRLAEQYGITGDGLAKICDRLNVPYGNVMASIDVLAPWSRGTPPQL